MSKEMRKASSLGVRTLRRKVAPDCCSRGRTFCWEPEVSSRRPMVSGRFFSLVKFLMVCAFLSSSRVQSSLTKLVMKPSLSRAEKKRLTRLTLTLMEGESMSATGWGGASDAGGGPPGEGASWAESGEEHRRGSNASGSRVAVRNEGRIWLLDDDSTTKTTKRRRNRAEG